MNIVQLQRRASPPFFCLMTLNSSYIDDVSSILEISFKYFFVYHKSVYLFIKQKLSMRFPTILLSFVLMSITYALNAQSPQNDTIFIQNDVNSAVSFSKGNHKYLLIQNIIPADIPSKDLNMQLISSKSTEIDSKLFFTIGNHILIPLSLFDEKFYTLYIKKGKISAYTKRIVIK